MFELGFLNILIYFLKFSLIVIGKMNWKVIGMQKRKSFRRAFQPFK